MINQKIIDVSNAAFYNSISIIEEIKIKPVYGKQPLKGKDLKGFKDFLEVFSYDIVTKWINYFIYHKSVKFERISKKLK